MGAGVNTGVGVGVNTGVGIGQGNGQDLHNGQDKGVKRYAVSIAPDQESEKVWRFRAPQAIAYVNKLQGLELINPTDTSIRIPKGTRVAHRQLLALL